MYLLKRALLRTSLLQPANKNLKKWLAKSERKLINHIYKYEDFRVRGAILMLVAEHKNNNFDYLLEIGLNDKEKPVFLAAKEAIKKRGLITEYADLIRQRNQFWIKKETEFKKNWAQGHLSMPGKLYINKDEMKQFKKLKALLAKQKGSMSIG